MKFPQQNINQSEPGTDDKKLSVELHDNPFSADMILLDYLKPRNMLY